MGIINKKRRCEIGYMKSDDIIVRHFYDKELENKIKKDIDDFLKEISQKSHQL